MLVIALLTFYASTMFFVACRDSVTMSVIKDPANEDGTLQLVHVIFRHGNRTNIKDFVYPKDPHKNITYYPYGFGQLNKKGYKLEYMLGKALRKRYDKFLGKIYTPEILDARSSDTNRTKMSLELVLAGLFPPKGNQIWDDKINWQPIPYNFYPPYLDKVFFGVLCPNYKKALEDYRNSKDYQSQMEKFKELFQYLSNNTGVPVNTDKDVFRLYNGMVVEQENGLTLPNWTSKVFPQPLKDIAENTYLTETATTELKKLGSGYLLGKIMNDTNAKVKNDTNVINRKMYLYSGHEFNLAFFLITLGVFKPHIPPYGGHIIMEVHQINGTHGFKAFYHDYSTDSPNPLKLPSCDTFCPLEKFIELYVKSIPDSDDCEGQTNQQLAKS